MKKVIIVTGSARPNSTAKQVAPLVAAALEQRQVSVEVIDVATLDLPFFNFPTPPAAEDYAPTDAHVVAWATTVAAADGVVLLTPEYNGGPSAIQKNALDWLRQEWEGKPVALIGYGWYDPSRAQASLAISLDVVKAQTIVPFAQLQFGKDLQPDGSVKDTELVNEKLTATLDVFCAAL